MKESIILEKVVKIEMQDREAIVTELTVHDISNGKKYRAQEAEVYQTK